MCKLVVKCEIYQATNSIIHSIAIIALNKGEKTVKSGTPGESRTPNLLIRSQALYPIELRVQGLVH